MDALLHILRAMRIESAVHARLEASAPWGIRFCQGRPARFGVVARGACWIRLGDEARLTALATGDCFVLAHGGVFELRDDPATPALSCHEVIGDRMGETIVWGTPGGARTVVVAGTLSFDTTASRPLLDVLPRFLHLPAETDDSGALRTTLELLAMETAKERLGAGLVAERLGEILFVQAVRAFVGSDAGRAIGWLAALSDRRVGAALRALHEDVARPWTVVSLAAAAGMSRSAFAQRFKELVGEAPLEHLARWRMYRASCFLRNSTLSLGEIAGLAGYDSDGAFSRAFKRYLGVAPGEYRRAAVS